MAHEAGVARVLRSEGRVLASRERPEIGDANETVRAVSVRRQMPTARPSTTIVSASIPLLATREP